VRGDRLYFFEIEARCVRGMFILCHDIIYLVDKMSVEIKVATFLDIMPHGVLNMPDSLSRNSSM
jgi:hypothetical protein